MNKTYDRLIISLAVVMLSALTMPAAARQSFQGLGDLPGGVFQSRAAGVSADGSVVVGFSSGASGTEAFRWTSAGGMVGLGDLEGGVFSSDARGVSADGSVVVGFGTTASGREAFRWTSEDGMIGLGFLPDGFESFAFGVSGDGSVVVGRSFTHSGEQAFRWTSEEGMVGLGDLPGGSFNSRAHAVSADGSVVVGFSNGASGTEAFIWTSEGGMVGLGFLKGGDFISGAFGVSADGLVVVGVSVSNNAVSTPDREAFRWTSGGGMVGLGTIAGSDIDSFANSVSGDGSVVVGRGDNFSFKEAFIWDETNGMQSLMAVLEGQLGLNLTGWTLFGAIAVSADGTKIVGSGGSPPPDGFSQAFIADFTPVSTGAVVNVPADQPTIQAGINAALRGDEVIVAPGIYFEVINFSGKAITVRSSGGANVTTIDGTGLGDSVVSCISREGPSTVLEGFTLTGGSGSTPFGSLTGGGMFILNSNPTVINCRFTGNSALFGGGLQATSSSPLLVGCVFDNNSASGGSGGGLAIHARTGFSDAVVINCTFSGNTAFNAGGLYILGINNVVVTNCIFWDNSAIIFNEVRLDLGAIATFSSCDIKGSGGSGGGWTLGIDGGGNIDADPLFVDASLGNLRLQAGSPCINVGNDSAVPGSITTDIDGNNRIEGTAVDMGAYEFDIDIDIDSDDDGVLDADDACPDSDLGQTIVIGGIDTGVENELFGDGCTIADLIDAILAADPSTVEVVQLLVDLKAEGIITGRDLGATLKALNSP